jgi:hypothetical protein
MRLRQKDMVIVKKLRWYHLWWHRLITLLGKEAYACEVVETENYCLELTKVWLCPGCGEYKWWDEGCAHEDPKLSRLCDDCFVKGGHLCDQ